MTKSAPITLIALILFSLLVACSSKPGAESDPITLTFILVSQPWLADPSGDYERLAASFHAANPEFAVRVKAINYQELPQGPVNADFFTDPEWGVDVVLASADLLPALVEQGLVRDLGPALEGNSALGAEDFYPTALDTLRWRGQLYGLPAGLDPWVLFYNQDAFDAAGVSYPSGNWNWDDLITTARALKKPGFFPFGSWGAQATPFIYQNGGRIVDDPLAPEKATLDDPATVEAVRWYVNLALLEGVMPTPDGLAGYATDHGRQHTIVSAGDAANKAASQAQADLEQAVNSGDAAMWMGPLSEGGGRWERWDFRWSVAPLPAGRQAATLADVQGYFILTRSEHFDQALRWVDYLTRQPPPGGDLPARRSVAATDAFRGQARPQVIGGLDACLAALENGLLLPKSLDWMATRWLQSPLFAVLAGELTVEEALQMAQEQAMKEMGQE